MPVASCHSAVLRRAALVVGAVGAVACSDGPPPSSTPLVVAPEVGVQSLAGHLEAFVDPEGTLTVDDVRGPAADRFEPVGGAGYVQGHGAYAKPGWLRFTVRNDSDALVTRVLELGSATIDEVTAWPPDLAGAGWRAGLSTDIADRVVRHPAFRFPVNLAPGESATWHLRVRDEGSIATALVLGDRDALDTTWAFRQLFDGTVVVLLAWTLLLAVGAAVLERSRAAWAFASTTFGLLLAHAFFFWGLPAYLLPVDARAWTANRLAVVTSPFVWAGLATLGLHTLDLRRHAPRLTRALLVAVAVLCVNTFLLVAVSYATTFPLQHVTMLVALGLLLTGTGLRASHGQTVAVALLATFVTFLVSYVFLVLRTFGAHGLLTDLLFNVATLLFVSGLVGSLRLYDARQRAEREAALVAHAEAADRSVRRSVTFERFVPRDALRLVHTGPTDGIVPGELATRTLTVVAATRTLDPGGDEADAYREVVAWAGAAEALVVRAHGFVHGLDGTTLTALFPEASADDALEVATALVRLAPGRVRVGVHRGPVVLATVGDSHHLDVALGGEALRCARRLAEPGADAPVVVSEPAVLAASPSRWSVRTLDPVVADATGVRRYGLDA